MTDRLLLLADDLTGCLDAAVQFSRAGVSVLVTAENPVAITDPRPGVVAADLESRHLAPAQAAARVEECVRAAARAGIRRFYKKTDSTLRGNVGAELCSLIRATGFQELYFVPALPDADRITRGGIQYVEGLPLDRSRYARDAVDPVREASVEAIIASQTSVAVTVVSRGSDPAPALRKWTCHYRWPS
ncbi:MAG TPA: four-carbon acid sugar kinase family protein [Spirochaetia bacterium]|nr:four-carbon acid sugar kinase family protein [Spirochaetia bacterium]